MVNFTTWSAIFAIRRLVITTRTTEQRAFVYGNGVNQTEVVIHMNAVNSSNQEIINTPANQLLQHSKLLDYVRGDALQNGTNLPPALLENVWSFSLVDNGFNFEPPAPAGPHEDTPSVPVNINAAVASFFVMCGPRTPARTRQVAVQVTLTHPNAPLRVYQTSLTGTPGFNSQVNLTALDPIDYSLAQNRRVQQGVATTERRDIHWQLRTGNNPIEPREDGTRKRHYVRLSPLNSSQFRQVENLSGIITNSDMSSRNVVWNGQNVTGFIGLNNQFPVSVLGRAAQFVPFQVNYWYINPAATQINGHYLGQGPSSVNPPGSQVFPALAPNEVVAANDPGMLVCYKFTVEANNQFPFGWASAERFGLALRQRTGMAIVVLFHLRWMRSIGSTYREFYKALGSSAAHGAYFFP